MTLDSRPFAPAYPMAARRAGVAMIYQELSLAPDLTVAENILLGVEPTRNGVLDRQSMERSTTKAFAELGRASLRPEQLVGELSLPSNNSSRSRVQLRSARAWWCSTSPPAAWDVMTSPICSR